MDQNTTHTGHPISGLGSGTLRRSRTVLLASPRSFCAGVERAIEVVQRVLAQRAGPARGRRGLRGISNAWGVALPLSRSESHRRSSWRVS